MRRASFGDKAERVALWCAAHADRSTLLNTLPSLHSTLRSPLISPPYLPPPSLLPSIALFYCCPFLTLSCSSLPPPLLLLILSCRSTMVDVRHSKCIEKGCNLTPSFGLLTDGQILYCSKVFPSSLLSSPPPHSSSAQALRLRQLEAPPDAG